MYKKQVKLQKILCLARLIVSAMIFISSLGIMTDLYDMQDFNKLFLRFSIGMILVCLTLFVTNTHNRRKYYIGNYCSVALVSVSGIAFTVWAHGQIEIYKAQFLNINFEELAAHAEKRKTLYTQSTFWFDIHYLIFGLLVIGIILLIANAIWKRRLMKEEQALIAEGKETVA